MAQANHAAEDGHSDANGVVKVPPELRKAKVTQVMGLLERESVFRIPYASCMRSIGRLLTTHLRSALVDATLTRLERLNLSSSLS